MVMSVRAFSRASRSTFTTLFKLGSGQVEQLQLELSRVGRSSTRYSPASSLRTSVRDRRPETPPGPAVREGSGT